MLIPSLVKIHKSKIGRPLAILTRSSDIWNRRPLVETARLFLWSQPEAKPEVAHANRTAWAREIRRRHCLRRYRGPNCDRRSSRKPETAIRRDPLGTGQCQGACCEFVFRTWDRWGNKGRCAQVDVMADPKIAAQEAISQVQNINIPLLYANGFVSNLGSSDISIILLVDASPSLKLNLSYTSAKTLANMLGEIIKTLEQATNKKIMDSQEVEKGLRAFVEAKKQNA